MEYNPFSRQIREDPYPIYKELRDRRPAYYNPKLDFWALSRYDDVTSALQDTETYSSAEGISVIGPTTDMMRRMPTLIMMDPPRHTQLRSLVSRAFTPRRIAALEPRIRQIARELIDDFLSKGESDLVQDFTGPLPTIVIAELLGVPTEDRRMFKEKSNQLITQNADEVRARGGQIDFTPALELGAYLSDVYQKRRLEPRDDLMSALLAAEVDGQKLESPELIGFAFLLLVAGNETTTNLISNAVVLLDRYPGDREAVTARPELLPGAIEECLRFESPVQGLARTLTRDVEVHGEQMHKGQKVMVLYASANRDERRFPDPDRFDIARDTKGHLAFGFGAHFCLGSSLARLETRVALEELLGRIPMYEVADGGERMGSTAIRGWARLPITFGA